MYACDWWEYIHEEYISGEKYVPVGEDMMLKFQSGFAGWEYPGLQAKKYNPRISLLVRNMHA